jgi:hypothetical protein
MVVRGLMASDYARAHLAGDPAGNDKVPLNLRY